MATRHGAKAKRHGAKPHAMGSRQHTMATWGRGHKRVPIQEGGARCHTKGGGLGVTWGSTGGGGTTRVGGHGHSTGGGHVDQSHRSGWVKATGQVGVTARVGVTTTAWVGVTARPHQWGSEWGSQHGWGSQPQQGWGSHSKAAPMVGVKWESRPHKSDDEQAAVDCVEWTGGLLVGRRGGGLVGQRGDGLVGRAAGDSGRRGWTCGPLKK